MQFLGRKESVNCDICGNEITGKKRKAKDGVLCDSCLEKAGGDMKALFPMPGLFDLSIEFLKNSINKLNSAQNELGKYSFNARVGGLLVDYESKKWAIQMMRCCHYKFEDAPVTPNVYGFDEIIDVSLVVDEKTVSEVKKGGIGCAIVGAVTAKEKTTSNTTVSKAGLSIKLDREPIQHVYLPLLVGQITQTGLYAGLFSDGEKIVDEFRRIIERAGSDEFRQIIARAGSEVTVKPASVDTTDELRKYKSLLEDGVITQEDFDQKKKQLLNL